MAPVSPREDWIIYRGPGFLSVVLFGSKPTPSPVSKLPLFFLCLPVGRRRPSLILGERGGPGAEFYDRKKAWLALYNCLVLSAISLSL
jgi:hypothetical protein